MSSSQLACPYCHSLLNFGQAIPAGSTVPCLICNATFVTDVGTTAPEPPPVSAPPPPPVAAPHAITETLPTPAPKPEQVPVAAVPSWAPPAAAAPAPAPAVVEPEAEAE